ncbi:MAG: hypothetical protein ACKVS8_02575 [Phycisphaerales bacterium]
MPEWIDRLLGFRSLHPDQEGVRFALSFAPRPWEWAVLGIAALAAAWWCYRKIEGPLWGRSVLAASRALLIVLVAFLACGPHLERANESVEQDWVIALVDRSASMRIADAPGTGVGAGARVTRDEQLRGALAAHQAALGALAKDRTVLWLGFDSGTFDLKPSAEVPGLPALDGAGPTGRRTDLAAALEQGLARAAGRPVSGMVVFSDGRATDQPPRALLRRLLAERVPVVAVPLGSDQPVADWSVRSATGPGVAFAADVIPVEAVVERAGSSGSNAPVKVQLVDTRTGDVLDERSVVLPDGPEASERVTLTATPSAGAGGAAAKWAVRVVPDGAAGGPGGGDLLAGNNETPISVEIVDRPLRVLYLDGYPRWEYRYLQAILTREKSVASTATLLSPGRRYLQEGNTPMDALPNSPPEWDAFDVIVIGDVQPEVFSPEQLRQLRARVASGGAGLLWIGGDSATPGAWRSTPLADLLPMAISSTDTGGGIGGEAVGTWDRDVVMRPTPLADRLGVLRLLRTPQDGSWWPTGVGVSGSGWSRLRGAQRIAPDQLKPAAEVLATGHAQTPAATDADASALVLTMRYGAGRVVYVATDEIWRWRYGRGEDWPERFWLQLIRLLGRDSVARSGKAAVLTVAPQRAEVGGPVRVRVELLDQSLAEAAGSTLQLRVTRRPGAGEEATGNDTSDITLRASTDRAVARPGDRATFVGTFIPPVTGIYRIEITDALLAGQAISADLEAWQSDDELRRPETDHALLASLAQQTGGSVVNPADLDRLPGLLPRREVRLALAPDEQSLWDSPLALFLVVGLFVLEWVGRRLIRLV